MKILPVSTDNAYAFCLDGSPPAPPIDPGKGATLQYDLQHGSMTFVRFHAAEASSSMFCVDEVLVGGERMGVDGPPRAGSSMVMTITNTGSSPAHFSGVWELEDVASNRSPERE